MLCAKKPQSRDEAFMRSMKGFTMVKDVVCGMGIEEDDPATMSKMFRGQRFFFCSPECLLLFVKTPKDYIDPSKDANAAARITIDLVCGMEVDENNPPSFIEVNGATYYFCSNSCKLEFVQHLEQFIGRT